MDPVLLSRIQFGVSIGFHFLFPAATLGLTLFILIFESWHFFGQDETAGRISSFLSRLFSLVYVMGIATGLTLSVSFGTNWARFTEFAGDILGTPLVVEAVTAFAFESAFLAILIFGRSRVSRGWYWFSALAVCLGAHWSAFWILAANSWMQTPAGYALEGGKAVIADLYAAVINPTTMPRFWHTILAAWLTGAAIAAGLGAKYLRAGRHTAWSKKLLSMAVPALLILPLAQLEVGHISALRVVRHQPEKYAALEGVYHTGRNVPYIVEGIPDSDRQVIRWSIQIPHLLSWLTTGNANDEIQGWNAFPPDERPPLPVVFTTFHIMVILGFVLIGVGVTGGWLWVRKQLFTAAWYLGILPWVWPLPVISFEMGWMSAEIGRQPWIVHGLLKTADASSASVPAGHVLFSLLGLSGLYAVLGAVFVYAVFKVVQHGPEASNGTTEGPGSAAAGK